MDAQLHHHTKSIELMKILLAAGADINDKTLLDIAICQNNKPVINLLIDYCVDLSITDSLSLAIKHKRFDIVDLLISSGAPLDKSVYYAAELGLYRVALSLIEAGADINCKGRCNMTPLHVAALNCHPHIVELLIRKGASISGKDSYGRTLLDIAKERGRKDIIDLIIKASKKASRM